MSVSARFASFLESLKITEAQATDGAAKRESVVRVLNQQYWSNNSGTSNSKYVGSWAKQTRRRTGGGHLVCMTTLNGWYKYEDYDAQCKLISDSNTASSGNTRDLIRMMKCWQRYCSVPLKSFHIELMAVSFLNSWGNRGKSTVYYDWMVRDFLAYLLTNQNGHVYGPGTGETMSIGSAWASRAQTALGRATKACMHEANKQWAAAGEEWQKVFGSDIPKYV